MSSAATLVRRVSDADISPEIAELLRAGASDHLGLICSPGNVRKNWPVLREAEKRGFVRFLDIERPWITPAGRAAIGAPSEMEASMARLRLLCGGARKPLVPAKRNDPRTDFDYRSYRSMGYVCVLAVRLPDERPHARTILIAVPNSSRPQGLGAGNSIIMAESDEHFVLAVVPAWLQKKTGLPTYVLPLPDDDTRWNANDRSAWDRLRKVCFNINSRIRNSNRGQHESRRFGEHQ